MRGVVAALFAGFVLSAATFAAWPRATSRVHAVSLQVTDRKTFPPPIDSIRCARRDAGTATEVAVVDVKSGVGATFESDAVYGLLNAITGDGKIGAIALRVDSSGGDSYASKKLYEALRKAKSTCGLPMASFIGNVATSGGFWIAMAADEVHADPLSTVGAVGIIAIFANETEKYQRQGIRYSVIRTGNRKWPLIPYLPVNEADTEKIKDSLAAVLDEFVAAVEIARKPKLKLDRAQLTTGEAWMGREAFALGLVDGPDDIDTVSARLIGAPPTAYRVFDLSKAGSSQPLDPAKSQFPVAANK